MSIVTTQNLSRAPHTANIEVFYSYSHKDKKMRDELERHIKLIRFQDILFNWHDGEIIAGKDWEREIEDHLATAHIILLLISVDFLNSLYCSGIEMTVALERHKRGEACVIPVLLRPVYWEDSPFCKLQILPTGAKPVTRWSNRDEAFRNIAVGIRKAIEDLVKNH